MKKVKAFFGAIWKGLVAFWKFLDGRKRTIALIFWTVMIPAEGILWPDQAPPSVAKTIAIIGLLFSALGLGHAAVKQIIGSGQTDQPS